MAHKVPDPSVMLSQKLTFKWMGPENPILTEWKSPHALPDSTLSKIWRIRSLTTPAPPEVGPTHEALPPELVDSEEEFEVEDIIEHQLVGLLAHQSLPELEAKLQPKEPSPRLKNLLRQA